MSPLLEPIPKSTLSLVFSETVLMGFFGLLRGKLGEALELYRRAEAYVPDNVKLKERWILFIIQVFLLKLEHERRR